MSKVMFLVGRSQAEWGRNIRRKLEEAGIKSDVVISAEERLRELASKAKDIEDIRKDIRMRAGK